jgi:hypothetical protein
MLALLKHHLEQVPFKPFRVVTTSGRAYEVPTHDHAVVFPMLRRLTIANDAGDFVDLHTLHISSIELLRRRRDRAPRAA